jgi:hypothetical protein
VTEISETTEITATTGTPEIMAEMIGITAGTTETEEVTTDAI